MGLSLEAREVEVKKFFGRVWVIMKGAYAAFEFCVWQFMAIFGTYYLAISYVHF